MAELNLAWPQQRRPRVGRRPRVLVLDYSRGGSHPHPAAASKRVVDVAVAAGVLLLTAPLLVLVMVAVKLESPGPVFYRATRAGWHGRPLRMVKFRKMSVDATGSPLTARGDPRLTRLGPLLVRTHLDELPQLWNVLKGEMSLVGPRPEDPGLAAARPADYAEILRMRPGMTGWTQLLFADEARLLDVADPVQVYVDEILPCKAAWDRRYVGGFRLGHDIRLLVWTVLVMLGWSVVTEGTTLRLVRAAPAPCPTLADAPAVAGSRHGG